MIRQDYILRIIEQLAQFLARILKLNERGDFDAAMSAIEDALKKLVGLDLSLVEALSLEDLVALLKPGIDLDVSRCIVVADLLKARGDVRQSLGDEDAAIESYVRALTLYLEALSGPGSIELPEQIARAEALVDRLSDVELPAVTLVRLARFHEKAGRFAEAEDAYWDLAEESGDRQDVDLGLDFYERLLKKSDRDLEAGGLPRDEVEDGLARLETLLEEQSEEADD